MNSIETNSTNISEINNHIKSLIPNSNIKYKKILRYEKILGLWKKNWRDFSKIKIWFFQVLIKYRKYLSKINLY